MFSFSKKYKNAILKELVLKSSVKNYNELNYQKGEYVQLSFFHEGSKRKDQSEKLKNLLVLELIGLQKGRFSFRFDNSEKKKIFISTRTLLVLKKKYADYFFFNFAKYSVSHIQNISEFAMNPTAKAKEFEVLPCYNFLENNKDIFFDLQEVLFEKTTPLSYKKKDNIDIQLFSFYKITL